MKSVLLCIVFMFCWDALAQEMRYLMRSPRALLMGDAFTSIADDEFTLYYNPAALAKNSGVSLSLFNPHIGLTNALDEEDRYKDFPSNDAAAIADRVLGFPLYLQGGIAPGFKFGPLGFSLIGNINTTLMLRNAIHPFFDIDYRYDRGFAFGYAYTLGSGGNILASGKQQMGAQTAIGVGLKSISREGLQGSFDLFGTELLKKLSTSSTAGFSAIREELGYSKGQGYGVDLGFLHSYYSPNTDFSMGLSFLDIGDTRFKKESGNDDIPVQQMMANFGASWQQDFTFFHYGISMDIKPLNQPIPWQRKMHFGVQIGIPSLTLLAGYSEGYVSYGIEFNLWLFKINAGLYSVELGHEFRQEEGSRGVFSIRLLDFSFDV